jgi:Family of unknown function (DUF5947)
MTGTGLRRFTGGTAGPPAAPPASTAGAPAAPPASRAGIPAARPAGQSASDESCEFCSCAIPADHGHVADLGQSALTCACRACYLLFTQPGAGTPGTATPAAGAQRQHGLEPGRGRYQAVPDRYRRDPERPLSPAEWDALQIPVGLAFFLRNSDSQDTRAFYPGPAGVTECELNLEAWARVAADHPLLDAALPDVEAILVSSDEDGCEAFLVPVDACYELAGRMRLLWHGFDGGSAARQSVTGFLERVRERSRDLSREP